MYEKAFCKNVSFYVSNIFGEINVEHWNGTALKAENQIK